MCVCVSQDWRAGEAAAVAMPAVVFANNFFHEMEGGFFESAFD